jgi:hypothetical protein
MKYTGRWTVRALPGGGGLARPFSLVQAQGAPDPLRLARALNPGTPLLHGQGAHGNLQGM